MENSSKDSYNSSDGPSKNHSTAKVVVVGAGIAGVTAAAKLIQNGLKDVVVLEAQDYVGGRVKSQMFGNKMIDLGAMFIHGRKGNPLFQIAAKVGTIIEDGHDEDIVNRPNFFYTSRRQKVPFQEVEELIDHVEQSLENMDPHMIEEGLSREKIINGCYNQFLQDHKSDVDHNKKELYDAAFRWYCFYEVINEGANSLKDVGGWACEQYEDFGGNRYTRVKGGYTTIIQALTDLIPKGLIRTQMPVVSIDWTNAENGNIVVRCENGSIINTSHVIVTMSSACLKATHSSMFHPVLPTPFCKSLQSIELGVIGKIFLKWESPFWDKEQLSYEFLWLKSHPVSLEQDKSMRKTKLGKPWWQDIPGVETVSEHDNVLLIWLLQHQVEVVKDLDDSELTAVLHELLQFFFFDLHIPKPTFIYKSEWQDNPYIRGTYSYPTPSFQRCDAEHLRQPIPSVQNPHLLFAGEAFSLEHMTTTHGAFITGECQADHVLHANGITDTVSVVDAITDKH